MHFWFIDLPQKIKISKEPSCDSADNITIQSAPGKMLKNL